jgi:hypothetical protein
MKSFPTTPYRNLYVKQYLVNHYENKLCSILNSLGLIVKVSEPKKCKGLLTLKHLRIEKDIENDRETSNVARRPTNQSEK